MLGGHGRTKFPCRLFYSLLPATLMSTRSKFDMPDYCVSIPRMQLSPCRELVVGFEVETSNRVIRKFTTKTSESFFHRAKGMFSQTQGFKPESFLRLHVTDEDSRSIFDRDLTGPVEEKLKKAILSGIMICGRKYSFLAYSSSQLKECSVWMVCLPPGWTVKEIRSTLGDFSACQSASKYAARIGQCFSTTVNGAKGQDHAPTEGTRVRHAVIDDIYGEDKSMCHSDGTGMIRRSVLNQLIGQLPFSPKDPLDASIIQVIIVGGRVGSPLTLRLTMLVRTSVSLLLNSFCLFSFLAVTSRSDSEAPKGH
jgi:RNA dependent RNA polymerase